MPITDHAAENPTLLKCCWACCSMAMRLVCGVSRKIERATYEAVPFRFMAGNLHPDHDTLATFRRTFLPELKDLFMQVLLLAQEAGVLKVGTISLDGTKIHADASKHNAGSYKRLRELETQLRAEVEELFALSGQFDQREIPDGL